MRIDGQHIRETMSGAVGGDRRVAETPPGGTADTAATGSTTGGVGSGQPVESQSTARSGAAAPGLGGEGAPGGGVAGASHTNSAELGALLDRAPDAGGTSGADPSGSRAACQRRIHDERSGGGDSGSNSRFIVDRKQTS
ncbi:MAG: hypothetical protein R3E01_20555 [Pirellulaceae bacterium]